MDPLESSLLAEQFGPLQGVRILSTGTIVAEPMAAAWAADPAAAAAVIRYRAAQSLADEPAPDSCAVLENTKRSYAAYGDYRAADPESVRRFEAAEHLYVSALRALRATV